MSKVRDSDLIKEIDRIMAVAWRMAMEAGATFINRNWIARRLKRSPNWVTVHWKKTPEECLIDRSDGGRPCQLSQESKDIILHASGQQHRSCRQVAEEILNKRAKTHSRESVRRFRFNSGIHPFRVIAKPLKTETHISDRLWLASEMSSMDEADFLSFAFSDEFFVYAIRKPNHQNDWVWSTSLEEIPDHEHYRQMVAHPVCIGLFVMFTAKRMMWVIKEKGQSWTGDYFRDVILQQHVLPFLVDPANVICVGESTFVHDKAPCMRANATQALLRNNGIQFWGNDMWPGNSPDLNPAEQVGEEIKRRVDVKMHAIHGPGRYSEKVLRDQLQSVLIDMEYDNDFFETLLSSMPSRFTAVRDARGGHTSFWLRILFRIKCSFRICILFYLESSGYGCTPLTRSFVSPCTFKKVFKNFIPENHWKCCQFVV